MKDRDRSETLLDWYSSAARTFLTAAIAGLTVAGTCWASQSVSFQEFMQKFHPSMVVPVAGAFWILSFIVIFLRDSLKEVKSSIRRQEKEFDQLCNSLHEVRIECQIARENFRAMAEHMRELQKEIAERPQGALVNAATNGRWRDEFQERITFMESKMDGVLSSLPAPLPATEPPPAPIETAPAASAAPSEDDIAPFEVYRADLLRMWDGDISLDEFVRTWSGRKRQPRPRPPAAEVSA